MRLQRIYASKIYVTSARKDKIHAAIQDPVNAELVQQLAEYLDDEAYAELEQAVSEERSEETPTQDTSESAETSAPASSNKSGGSHSSGGHSSAPSSFTGDILSDFGEDELADIPEPESDQSGDTAASEPEPVSETTKTDKESVTASTAIIWTTLDDVISDCASIKGTLNLREDTCGVTRIQVSDHELWIYYNDDSNLNDKMVEVIGVLNAVGYTYLKFNRLARSNNAIVFDVLLSNTEEVKSIKDIEEETE